MNNIRLVINVEKRKEYECLFSKNLSLEENIKLLSKIINEELDGKIIVTHFANMILNPNKLVEDFDFNNGDILYLY